MIGVPIRNEKRADSACLRPDTTPATMVEPEREMPGMRARHWAKPTASAPFQLSWSSFPTVSPAIRSPKYRRNPLTIRKTAAIQGTPNACASGLCSAAPITTAGIVARTTSQNRRRSAAERAPVSPTRERAKLIQSRQKKMKSAIAVPRCITVR